jgi:hypothetical protein
MESRAKTATAAPQISLSRLSSNPMPRSALSLAFFASSQAKYFTRYQDSSDCVPRRHTVASAEVCARVCPNGVRRPSSGSQRQPRSE